MNTSGILYMKRRTVPSTVIWKKISTRPPMEIIVVVVFLTYLERNI